MVFLTTIDPVAVTEYSVVFSAVALPLTNFPILVVANDPDYMGEQVNGRNNNALSTVYLVLVCHRRGGDPVDDRHEGRPMTGTGNRTGLGLDSTRPRQGCDAALHLLDRQIVDREGRMLANVNDLELTEDADGVSWSPPCNRARRACTPDRRPVGPLDGGDGPSCTPILTRSPGRPTSATSSRSAAPCTWPTPTTVGRGFGALAERSRGAQDPRVRCQPRPVNQIEADRAGPREVLVGAGSATCSAPP